MRRTLITSVLLFLVAGTLLAHGKGKLKLGSQHLTVGGTVELTGTEFAKKEPFTVLLIGTSGRTTIGEVRSDSLGKFSATVTVPATLAPGSYRLALEASDDDEAASADVMLMAGENAVVADDHQQAQHAGDGQPPSHQPLQLARARSPLVTGGAIAAIVAMFALGGVLLRRNGGA